MHQVNKDLIKPLTRNSEDKRLFIPGLSYALQHNFSKGGLLCRLFYSHAWDEGVFELINNAVNAWPDDCEGAYICCLSNPQNLDIGKLLGTDIANSPFNRILGSGKVTDFVMLANGNTPIHSRMWCVFEAHKASHYNIGNVSISGKPVHLLMGANQKRLRAEEEKAERERKLEDERVREELDLHLNNPELLSDPSSFKMDLAKLQGFAQSVAQAKLDVLRSSDVDLIDLDKACCSDAGDAERIRSEISGDEAHITTLICRLIRECICGVGVKQANEPAAEGTLQLPLDKSTVDLSIRPSFKGNPLLLLRFARWLRQTPKVQRLVVTGSQLTEQGVKILRSTLEEGLLPGLHTIDPLDKTEALCTLAKQVSAGTLPRAMQPAQTKQTGWRDMSSKPHGDLKSSSVVPLPPPRASKVRRSVKTDLLDEMQHSSSSAGREHAPSKRGLTRATQVAASSRSLEGQERSGTSDSCSSSFASASEPRATDSGKANLSA